MSAQQNEQGDQPLTQFLDDEDLNQYPWPGEDSREAAADALATATVTRDQLATLTRRMAEMDDQRRAAAKQADAQRRNDLIDELARLCGLTIRADSVFDGDQIHADQQSMLNGITAQHWLNALADWEHNSEDPEPDSDARVCLWYGDQDMDEFLIEVSHAPHIQGNPPEIISLTAYRMDTFEWDRMRGPAAGGAVVFWPY